MIYLILIILGLTGILYFIYKDFFKILKITSIVTIISGVLTFGISYLFKYFTDFSNFSSSGKLSDNVHAI